MLTSTSTPGFERLNGLTASIAASIERLGAVAIKSPNCDAEGDSQPPVSIAPLSSAATAG
ncbi:hypothetical protein [Caballeronia novacaledonica]|uniref:hypothetical protein n=1 Tax=Caballeronia novacaledonica TaxID=1544861 RepID=UPI0015E65F28|nr:hypothetical protein [Caballeronia novacaledonica]